MGVSRVIDTTPKLETAAQADLMCRGALLADQAALEQWKTNSPILIMGSHKWNTPNARGQLACGGERQARLLQAVRYR